MKEIEDLLRNRAADVTDGGPGPEAVRRQAARLRRRRAAMPLIAAATVGVVVLTAVVALHRPATDVAPGPTPSGPSSTASNGAPPRSLRSLPMGARTDVLYAVDRVVAQTGERVPGKTALDSFLRFGDGWLVFEDGPPPRADQQGDNPPRYVQYDARGHVVRYLRSFVPDVGADRVAVTTGSRLSVDSTRDAARTDYGVAGPYEVVIGFLAEDQVVTEDLRGAGSVRVRSVHGKVRLLRVMRQAFASSAAGDLVLGSVGPSGREGVVDARTGRVLWQGGCDLDSPRFSPDGRYVAGLSVEGSRHEDSILVCDARTGKHVRLVAAADGRIVAMSPPVWEQSSTLIFQARDHGTALVRLGVDGSLERTTTVGPIRGYPNSTVLFAAQP